MYGLLSGLPDSLAQSLLLCCLQIRFADNTDPAGIDHQIAQLGPELATTLVIVISKVCLNVSLLHHNHSFPLYFSPSGFLTWLVGLILDPQSGGTPETRNGLLEVQKAFREAGLDFAKQVLTSASCYE